MTDLIKDLQKQAVPSNIVELFELELPAGNTLYFTSGLDANSANITFDGNTYVPLPAEINGIELASDGASSRPTLKIANIFYTFRDAIGSGYTYEDMLGKKLTRRRTLVDYLASSPAQEYPQDIFYIDRISNRSIVSIDFELANPFDLEGVKLPNRIIVGGSCPWKYQGASPELSEKVGGCIWNSYSTIYVGGVAYTNYVNVNDEVVVPIAAVVGAWGGTGTLGNIYSTTASNLIRIENDGTFTYNVSSNNYWQVMVASANTTPADDNTDFRRVRVYSAYSNTSQYVFTDPSYNSYVTYTYDGGARLFKKKYISQANDGEGATPGYNAHWEIGDSCGKRLFSCTRRFQYKPGTSNGQTVANTTYDQTIILPYGGFPGSRLYN